MSTLTVSNVSDGSLSIPTTYVTNGSAKAWVNFNGTGTIAARDSLNVSSLTDRNTGRYTINFTNSMSAADYATTATAEGDSYCQTSVAQYLAASVGMDINTTANAGVDRSICSEMVKGDLA